MNDKEKVSARRIIKHLEEDVYCLAVEERRKRAFSNLPLAAIMFGIMYRSRNLSDDVDIIGGDKLRKLCNLVSEKNKSN